MRPPVGFTGRLSMRADRSRGFVLAGFFFAGLAGPGLAPVQAGGVGGAPHALLLPLVVEVLPRPPPLSFSTPTPELICARGRGGGGGGTPKAGSPQPGGFVNNRKTTLLTPSHMS